MTDNIVSAVKYVRSLGCRDVQFTPEDAGDIAWLAETLSVLGLLGALRCACLAFLP